MGLSVAVSTVNEGAGGDLRPNHPTLSVVRPASVGATGRWRRGPYARGWRQAL